MRTCPWCEGRKVVGQMIRGEDAKTVSVLGQKIPVVEMRDRPCGICNGTGEVTDERYAELTVPRSELPT
jgi:hypothetical protein